MEWNSKNSFSKGEKLVMAASVPIGNMVYKFDRKQHRTIRELLEACDLDLNLIPKNVKDILNHKVSQVSRAGSRFTKDCICVQLYEDGPEVLRWAMQHGAILCISRYQIDDYPCIVVDKPEVLYSKMCCELKSKNAFPVAITGSIGKTTAKKMIDSMYKTQFKTFCDAGNDNQLDCVGYISQHIPKKTKIWIQEVSEDTRGQVNEISRVVAPKIAVITAIDKSHIEEYGDESGILNEIHSIVNYMPDDGICITSIDEENTASLIKERRVVTVSLRNKNADFYACDIEIMCDGIHFAIVEKKYGKKYKLKLHYVFALHNIYAALYAFACGVNSGVSYENIVKGIENYKAAGIRQNIYSDKGVIIYADCYNAVAKSVASAVKAAEKIPITGKRIAVIGDIAETGNYTEITHKELNEIVNNSCFNVLLAYGKNMCIAAKNFKHRPDLLVVCCDTKAELNTAIKKNVKSGDLILFKASHSTGLEKSIMHCFPVSYITKAIGYYWPQVIWRFVVLFN